MTDDLMLFAMGVITLALLFVAAWMAAWDRLDRQMTAAGAGPTGAGGSFWGDLVLAMAADDQPPAGPRLVDLGRDTAREAVAEIFGAHVGDLAPPAAAVEVLDAAKPFWLSRGVVGGGVAVLLGAGSLFGWAISPADAAAATDALHGLAVAIAGAVAVWGRISATRRVRL